MLLRLSPRRLILLSLLVCAIIYFTLSQPLSSRYSFSYDRLQSFANPFSSSLTSGSSAPVPTATFDDDDKNPLHPPPAKAPPPQVTYSPLPKLSNPVAYIQKVLDWPRPKPNAYHWPPYEIYENRDYDPNRWENFEEDNRYYDKNGVELAKENPSDTASPYLPYPNYNTDKWRKQWKGDYVACEGPRGLPLNESSGDIVKAYSKIPPEFPIPFTGSNEAIGLDYNRCFERYDRYGPYGFGEDDDETSEWTRPSPEVDWLDVNWGRLQNECLKKNMNRYAPESQRIPPLQAATGLEELEKEEETPPWAGNNTSNETDSTEGPEYRKRTAILIRTWTGYKYTPNDMHALRSMISELALLSGGEYQVFLYVHVKDRSLDIYNDPAVYERVLKENVPKELRDVAILWNENVGEEWYPQVGDWQVYWQQFMCIQLFMKQHPEFEYVWNWETDARYTGQHYHFLEKMTEFAKRQPRKYLWERNKRYYIPATHGTYEDFVKDTNRQIANASAEGLIEEPVWGPKPVLHEQRPIGPKPPHPQSEDNFEWGVGEEADLIMLLPIFDPRRTIWPMRNHIWNFVSGIRPIFTPQDPTHNGFDHPDFPRVDRRCIINTVVRLSRKMVQAMHEENLAGRSMQAEMWTISTALHHGLKAVYAPQPVWSDRKWLHPYSDMVFNANGGVPGRWGEMEDSVYNPDREYNFQSWTWYYRSHFPRRLYRRWLGMMTSVHPWGQGEKEVDAVEEEEKTGNGHMCLPGMLLHPVKQMWEDQIK